MGKMVDMEVSDEAIKLMRLEAALERRREAAAVAADAAEAAAAARIVSYSAPIEPTPRSRSPAAAPLASKPGRPLVADATHSSCSWRESSHSLPMDGLEIDTPGAAREAVRRRGQPLRETRQGCSAASTDASRHSSPASPAAAQERDEHTASRIVSMLTFFLTLGSMHFCVAIGHPEKAPGLVILVAAILLIGNAQLTSAATMALDYSLVVAVRRGLQHVLQLPSTIASAIEVDTGGSFRLNISEDGWAMLGMCLAGLLAAWLLKTCFSNAEVCGNGIVSSVGFILEVIT